MMTHTANFKEVVIDMYQRGVIKLPKDDEHATRWCWGKKFEDGKVGYIQLLMYFNGSVKYSEFANPKLENGLYTECNVRQFNNIEHLIDDF